LVPALENGRVVYQDSPLIRAVRLGRILIVDEADKAPLEVVVLLKNLVEDGEMLLADGRKIMSPERMQNEEIQEMGNVIPIHPDFRLWVLANRPGFPFLGNDFFRECGDVFSVHAIDNPDVESEALLLSNYAPNLPQNLLQKFAQAFSDLREMHHSGVMAYPYSIREAVAVIKHMSRYPNEGAIPALKNALSFDAFDLSLWEMIAEVFTKNGVPVGSDPNVSLPRPRVELAEIQVLPPSILTSQWTPELGAGASLKLQRFQLDFQSSPATATSSHYSVIPSRTTFFTEETGCIWLDKGVQSGNSAPYFHAIGLAKLSPGTSLESESIHVLTTNPLELHSFFGLESGKGRRVKTELLGTGWYSTDKKPLVIGVHSHSMVAVLLPKTNILALVDPTGGDDGIWMELFPKSSSSLGWLASSKTGEPVVSVLKPLAKHGILVYYKAGASSLEMVNLNDHSRLRINLPPNVSAADIQAVNEHIWLVQDNNGGTHVIKWSNDFNKAEMILLQERDGQTWEASFVGGFNTGSQQEKADSFMVHPAFHIQICQGLSKEASTIQVFSVPKVESKQTPMIQAFCSLQTQTRKRLFLQFRKRMELLIWKLSTPKKKL